LPPSTIRRARSQATITKAATKTYARDPFGRAISSTVGTTKTDYLFDGAEAIQQKTGTTATTYYTRGLGGQLINRRGGGNPLRYYHHDAIGSVVGLTHSTGALTDTYSYTAFGEVRARTGTNTQPFQYLGNLYDSDSKLLDFHARSYDPAVGRFTSKDPVAGFGEAPQSLNPYSYGYNGPLAYPDPYGQCPICVAAAPVIGRVAAAGKVVAVDAATNATISAGGYYLNHRAEKDEIDWAEFRRTVGQETLDQTLSDFKNPLNFLPTRKLQRAAEVLKFADKASDASRLLKKARQVSGRFPRTAGPGETLVRRDPTTGVPTNYQVYGRDGLPIKRVDLTGRAHGNVSTPHVVEYERHKNPNTGEVFVRASRTVRPAEPGEIP
jgi:RHS repeat-associated protein